MSDDPTFDEPDDPGDPGDLSALADSRALDELLSADLDGELDGAAADLGFSVDEARARIATPEAVSRRRLLASARDLVAEPPEIDELVAARLRAKAVRAAGAEHARRSGDQTQRRKRFLATAVGLAAAIAVTAAVAAGLHGHTAHTETASAKAASPSHASPTVNAGVPTSSGPEIFGPGAAPGLGAYASAHSLGLAARSQAVSLQAESATTGVGTAQAATVNGAVSSTEGPYSAVPSSSVPSSNSAIGATVPACTATRGVPRGDVLVLRSTATLSGKLVIVLVYTGAGEHTVVIEDTDCKLLDVQMLG